MITLSVGMERQNNFLLDPLLPIKIGDIKKASADLAKLPIEKMKDSQTMLSETLITVSLHWTDEWGDEGLQFVRNLIEKGANPKYPKVEEDGVTSHTQSAIRLASGKLLDYLKQYISDNGSK